MKDDLYEEFLILRNDAEQMVRRLAAMQEAVTHVLEQNAELEIENKNLRERLQTMIADERDVQVSEGVKKSRANLLSLYEAGYHVCPELYGQRRVDNETCAFCIETVYGDHNEKAK